MYSIEFIERGEQFRYTDENLSLILERTYSDGHRLFTQSIAAAAGQAPLTFKQRAAIIENLCNFFEVSRKATTFVVWEADSHRTELETLLKALHEKGELISIEMDSEERRQAAYHRQNLEILTEGWKVTIDGREFATPGAYKEWMMKDG